MDVTLSWFVKEATAAMFAADMRLLWQAVANVSLAIAIGIVALPTAFYLIYTTFSKGQGALRTHLFRHIQRLPAHYVEGNLSGDFLTRMTADADDAAQLFGYPAVGQGNLFSIVAAVVVLASLIIAENAYLGIPTVALSLLSVRIVLYFTPKIRAAEQELKRKLTEMTQGMIDTMGGNLVARMVGLVGRQRREFQNNAADAYRVSLESVRIQAKSTALREGYVWLLTILLLVAGSMLARYSGADGAAFGGIAIPSILYLVNLTIRLCREIIFFGNGYNRLQPYIVAADRVKALDEVPEEAERPDRATPDLSAEFALKIDGLRFSYKQGTEIISDLTLRVPRGERLAIVGTSGGGKTTLMKLILDLIDHDESRISIFGHRQEEYAQSTVRGLCAYVPQDCYLFDGSLRDNIRLGNLSAGDQELEKAARQAGLGAFIDNLPEGLDAPVGDSGARLSGGERQRVAIARAILSGAPLLLLDEATSSLDSQSEKQVQDALETLMEGRTSVIIAHRLQTIESADRIVVLENGKIVEEGSHRDLLRQKGRYADLYALQFV
jgi:ABC-type multidrug transport system fused ATPase/permease subunit